MDQLLLLKLLEVLTETRSPSLGKGKGTREQDSTHQRLQLPSHLGPLPLDIYMLSAAELEVHQQTTSSERASPGYPHLRVIRT